MPRQSLASVEINKFIATQKHVGEIGPGRVAVRFGLARPRICGQISISAPARRPGEEQLVGPLDPGRVALGTSRASRFARCSACAATKSWLSRNNA